MLDSSEQFLRGISPLAHRLSFIIASWLTNRPGKLLFLLDPFISFVTFCPWRAFRLPPDIILLSFFTLCQVSTIVTGSDLRMFNFVAIVILYSARVNHLDIWISRGKYLVVVFELLDRMFLWGIRIVKVGCILKFRLVQPKEPAIQIIWIGTDHNRSRWMLLVSS